MSHFLVIYRNEDEPTMTIMDRTELKWALSAEWKDYELLQDAPNFMYMPPQSVFIFQGEAIVDKWEIINTVNSLTEYNY